MYKAIYFNKKKPFEKSVGCLPHAPLGLNFVNQCFQLLYSKMFIHIILT